MKLKNKKPAHNEGVGKVYLREKTFEKEIFMGKNFCFDGKNILAYNDFGNKGGFTMLVQHGTMANSCFGEGQNLRIRFKDWGFTLPEIKAKVYMQHSKKDEVLPYIMAERTAKLLNDCELELLEEGDHFTNEGYESFIKNTMIKNIVK